MSHHPPALAFYDFDHTLVAGDSYLPFMKQLRGKPYVYAALVLALLLVVPWWWWRRPAPGDFKSALKEVILFLCCRGVTVADATLAAEALRGNLIWKKPWRETLRAHQAAGDKVIIVSGSLDIYLPILADELKVDGVLCTLAERRHGVLTGFFAGANCVRESKAARVRDFLAYFGAYGTTHGYGNPPDDLPMLALVQQKNIVPKYEAAPNSPHAVQK